MLFTPYFFSSAGEILPVVIEPATASDLNTTYRSPVWQTDWTSDYLSAPGIEKYAMKTPDGKLVALAAYQIAGQKAYVYILYVESAPHSNTTFAKESSRKNTGIGAVGMLFSMLKQTSWPNTMRWILERNESQALFRRAKTLYVS